MKLLRQLLLAASLPLVFTACASMRPPQPPSLELPKPPSDLRAMRKGDRVTLTWTIPVKMTDRQTVRSVGSTRICRGVEPKLDQCGTAVGEAPPTAEVSADKKQEATYSDILPADLQQSNSSGYVTYAVEVLNHDGRGAGLSNQARVPSGTLFPPFSNFAAEVTAQGVRLSWTLPAAPEKGRSRYRFRIYRKLEGSQAQDKIADLDFARCLGTTAANPGTPHGEQEEEPCPASYLDQSFAWEKTYRYRGTVVSVIGEPGIEVEGEDTPEVKVFADDVFPPAVPSGLQAVFSGQGQQPFIDLIWAPVMDADLDGYNIYRHEEGAAPVKVNAELVKAPAYRDARVVSGKSYWYSVSAVDVRGNESAKSEEASEGVP